MSDRVPPHDLDAERSVLGACMLDGLALIQALDVIGDDAEAFYREAHRRMWIALLYLCDRGEAVDMVTMASELARRGDLAACGGPSYLADLAAGVPTTANVAHYARIVADLRRRRRLLEAAERCVAAAYAGERSTESLAAELRAASELAGDVRDDPKTAGEVLAAARCAAEDALRSGDGIELGFPELARRMGPLLPGTLMVVSAAETSTGKTTMVLQSCSWAAARGRRALYVSVEMGPESVGARVGQLFAGVNLARPRTLSESDWRRVREAESEVPPTLWIDCWSHTTTEVAARASRLRSTIGGLDLVVVDGIHDLAEEPLTRGEREEASLARAAQRLKNLALTMRCAVIATAQPALESARQGRRPRVSDIRGSGRIGQIADVVLFLWRPPDAEEAGGRIRCEWILDKVRLGDRSRFPMDFDRAAGGLWRTPLSPRLEAALQEVS